jgi:hypothetical protein
MLDDTTKEIIQVIRAKIRIHQNAIRKYEQAIALIESVDEYGVDTKIDDITLTVEKDNPSPKVTKDLVIKGKRAFEKGEFLLWVNRQLDDGIPKLHRDLHEAYLKEMGNHFSFSAFASKMNVLNQRNKVTRFDNSNAPIGYRSYYCKTDWFENGKLKSEYLKKIKEV